MTDSKTPEWAMEEARAIVLPWHGHAATDQAVAQVQIISQALAAVDQRAYARGIEEAAKVAEERDPHWLDDGDHIARSIRQLLELKG